MRPNYPLSPNYRLSLDFDQQCRCLDAEHPRNLDEFQNVDLSFAGLDLPDEGIRPLQLCRQLSLRKACGMSGSDDGGDQCPMLGAPQLLQRDALN